MKNKKKVKLATTDAVATGVFKKRRWPWLFVIAAAIVPAVFYSMIAIEFFSAPRCSDCTTFYNYTFHYATAINNVLIAVGALVLVAILCAILFVRKRSLILTPTHLIYTKGRKSVKIDLSTIESFDAGNNSLIVKVPFKKFRFAKLKNKQEIYNALFVELRAPATVVTESVTSTPVVTASTVTLPTTSEGKIRYFQSLLAAKVITPEQFDKYTHTVLTTDFPTLYK